MSNTIRIKDIAQLAGVSVGTVDRVIHNRGQVSKDSYDRVIEILEKTGYKPNLIARTLGSNKIFHISAIIPDPSQDEYWGQSGEGIKEATDEWRQYGIVVGSFFFDLYDPGSFKQVADTVYRGKPDGIIAAPVFHNESIAFFNHCRSANIPYVVFNNNIPESNPVTFVGQDLYRSGRVAAELLQMSQHGPAEFAILHIYDDVPSSVHLIEKEKGFRDFFKEQPTEHFSVVSLNLNNTHESTLEKELLALLNSPRLRGVFVTTSKGASVVSRILDEHGKNGVRMVAYDLIKQNRHYLKKGIIDFLINQNPRRQAILSVNQLANHLLFNKKIQPAFLFPLEIISRQNMESYLNAGFH